MTGQQPVVENEILELTAFDSHQYRSMNTVNRREYPFLPGNKDQAGIPADPCADTASQTDIIQDAGYLAIRFFRIVGGNQCHGLDGAGADTFTARQSWLRSSSRSNYR